jgi:hypothetical protein
MQRGWLDALFSTVALRALTLPARSSGDHRARCPAGATPLRSRHVSVNQSMSRLDENVGWIDLRRMELLLERTNVTGVRWRRQQAKLAASRGIREVQNECILDVVCLQSVVRGTCSRARRQCDCAALAPALGLAMPSLSARAALHAWPRPKMAGEARAGRRLVEPLRSKPDEAVWVLRCNRVS